MRRSLLTLAGIGKAKLDTNVVTSSYVDCPTNEPPQMLISAQMQVW